MPYGDGKFTSDSLIGTGYNFWVSDRIDSSTTGNPIIMGIYNTEAHGLVLRVRQAGKLNEDYADVVLGRKVGQGAFTLGILQNPDGSVAVYVDNELLDTVNNALLSNIQYVGRDAIMLNNIGGAEVTVSDLKLTVLRYNTIADEITVENIFGDINLKQVTENLPLNTVYTSKCLGEIELDWTSSNEDVVAVDGTVTQHLTDRRYANLSVAVKGSEEPLWSVKVYVPASASGLKALLSETAVTVDGNLSELAWLNWMNFADKGNIAAAWTKGYAYFAVYSADADSLVMTLNGKQITVDLAAAKVTGIEGALIAKNAKTGVVEIGIPLTAIEFNLTDYNQHVSATFALTKDGTPTDLGVTLFVFSGDVAAQRPMAGYTKSNGPWTLLTNSITYKGTAPGVVDYVYKTDNGYDHGDMIMFSSDFRFDQLPVTTGSMISSTVADGFYYYFTDENATTRRVLPSVLLFTPLTVLH